MDKNMTTKTLALIGACALTFASANQASAYDKKSDLAICAQDAAKGKSPQGVCAVLETLNCIESEDLECALAGYAAEFVKLHNGIDTKTVINPEFWGGAFALLDITLEINHFKKINNNLLSIRYVETVTLSPSAFGIPLPDQTFLQHEHALVTFNKAGQMTLWDQYGDNAEQSAVTDAVNAIVAILTGS